MLHHESVQKLAEGGLSSDPSQTATANSTILIARAKVRAEVHTEALHIPNPLDYVLDSAGEEGLVSVFLGPRHVFPNRKNASR